jgi:hypothetical protein
LGAASKNNVIASPNFGQCNRKQGGKIMKNFKQLVTEILEWILEKTILIIVCTLLAGLYLTISSLITIPYAKLSGLKDWGLVPGIGMYAPIIVFFGFVIWQTRKCPGGRAMLFSYWIYWLSPIFMNLASMGFRFMGYTKTADILFELRFWMLAIIPILFVVGLVIWNAIFGLRSYSSPPPSSQPKPPDTQCQPHHQDKSLPRTPSDPHGENSKIVHSIRLLPA